MHPDQAELGTLALTTPGSSPPPAVARSIHNEASTTRSGFGLSIVAAASEALMSIDFDNDLVAPGNHNVK
jgi:hypothetical protein